MEACVDSVASAEAAVRGGATRLELCSALSVGGLTPTPGMLRAVLNAVRYQCYGTLPLVSVGLCPRVGGDFVYCGQEIRAMEHDLELLKEAGAKGVSLGVLKPDGLSLDEKACRHLISAAGDMPVTLNGAFDCALERGADPEALLDSARRLGFRRVLTCGGAAYASAEEGKDVIRRLVHHAGNHIVVMPRGGLTEGNLAHVLAHTGAAAFQVYADDLRPADEADEVEADHDADDGENEDNEYDAATPRNATPRVATPRVAWEDRIKRTVAIAKAHKPSYKNWD